MNGLEGEVRRRKHGMEREAGQDGKEKDVEGSIELVKDESGELKRSGSLRGRAPRWGDLGARVLAGVMMLVFCVMVMYVGHMAVCCFLLILQFLVFREITALGYEKAKDGRVPRYRTLSWFFFLTMIYFVYAKSAMAHFSDQGYQVMSTAVPRFLMRHHTFVVFFMYCAGFVTFVLSLRSGSYTVQFAHFGRTFVAIGLVVVQSYFVVQNVKQGMAWFVLPTFLVICNDTMAYVVGRMFGRHTLLSISPKKTVEGFVGGGIVTVIFGFLLSFVLQRYHFMVCPMYEFTDCRVFCRISCEPAKTFAPTLMYPPDVLTRLGINFSVRLSPFQLHAIALGTFASIIAPFGGFFASGAKRAFGVKDFATTIPGHGGVTDRVDCQLLMAVFTYVYIINFVLFNAPDVRKVMIFVSELSYAEQVELFSEIAKYLARKGSDVQQILSDTL
uniref:Phosphatidate cytidylyltransferase n=1 Tax=Compsopogon caeruleus TaxID=31354 RepID=A0A7S1TGD6_9RHOD|mmetsp:Transcript_5028/g.10158  ORF Transcript_5028/g.10158 Transcript_5028/m.10158 type:complete len:443 (+) Transcript_5028:351-1679(+)|eukprot:CAMPEP_0184690616 /NCGR_PEP_ID=MMETSP0312-20130426/31329_1 /TAXON_ID=31354 /ORGANISM="Compsopogon coeruleus, Strain SAG 36.94" /LENGTH=442 /DNA_ID=CAMNT_0027148137 /DNA_START=347 /DNA_END=1675 /DNA_ORIENTATION=+